MAIWLQSQVGSSWRGRPALVLNRDVEVDLVVKHGIGFDINQQKH